MSIQAVMPSRRIGQDYDIILETVKKPLLHHKLCLSYTATGYGNKLPTRFMVKYNKRWHRVYSICHSNVSSEYILSKGERIRIDLVQV